jgi:hypothetical protein
MNFHRSFAPLLVTAMASTATLAEEAAPSVKISGYVQANYQINFNFPDNLVTAYRGFDNRANSFTVEDAVLAADGRIGVVHTFLALQVGNAPASYYLSEPNLPAGAGVGPSGPDLWRIIQQAYLGATVPVGRGLAVDAGIFLSPIGIENLAIKDQWNWSRSNLFFALPFYHSGARATYALDDRWTATFWVTNGWNDIINRNWYPCFLGEVTYVVQDRLTVTMLWFGGVEDSINSPEGLPWRNLFDSTVTWTVRPSLAVAAQVDVGGEWNTFGLSSWAASAAYVHFQALPWFALNGRVDYFHSHTPSNSLGTARPLFFPADNVSSQTVTAQFTPVDHLALMAEYRHDWASSDMYFRGTVATVAGTQVLNAHNQDTLTLGATTWF